MNDGDDYPHWPQHVALWIAVFFLIAMSFAAWLRTNDNAETAQQAYDMAVRAVEGERHD